LGAALLAISSNVVAEKNMVFVKIIHKDEALL